MISVPTKVQNLQNLVGQICSHVFQTSKGKFFAHCPIVQKDFNAHFAHLGKLYPVSVKAQLKLKECYASQLFSAYWCKDLFYF